MPNNKRKKSTSRAGAAAATPIRQRRTRTAKRGAATSGHQPAKPTRSKPQHDVVSRLLAALEFVAQATEPVTAAHLASDLGIARATAYRIFARLEQEQVVIPEPGNRGFVAGGRLSNLAIATLTTSARQSVRHRVLEELVGTVGETCNLTILSGGEVIYIDRVETHWPLRMHLSRGSRVPAFCTATGKLLLGLLPKHEMQELVRVAPLRRYSEHTITDPDKLVAELAHIRAEQVGIDNEEFVAGMVAVAVPVFDKNRRAVAALAVHAPVVRLSLKAARRHLPALRKAAAALSDLLP